jgi:flagellar biosynthesis chaperone FliJ
MQPEMNTHTNASAEINTQSWRPGLQSLHRLRTAAAEQAREQLRLAREQLRSKDQEIAGITARLEQLQQDLSQRTQVTLLDQEFQRLARLWRALLQQQMKEAQQLRADLHAECEQRSAQLRAARLAVRTLERYCARLQAVQARQQASRQQREGDDRWLSRIGRDKAQPWL